MGTILYMRCFLACFVLHCASSSAIPTYTLIQRQRVDNPSTPPPPPTLPPLSLPRLDVYGTHQPGPYWKTVFERNIAAHEQAQRKLDELRESRQGTWGIDLPSGQPYYNYINSPPGSRKSINKQEHREDLRDPVIEEREHDRDVKESPVAAEPVNSDPEKSEDVTGAGTPKPPASLKTEFVSWLQDLVYHYSSMAANRLFENFKESIEEAFQKVDHQTPESIPQLETPKLPPSQVESKYNVQKESVDLNKDVDRELTSVTKKDHTKDRRHKQKPSKVEVTKEPVSSSSVKPEIEDKKDKKETNIEKYTNSQKVVNIFIFYPNGSDGGSGSVPLPETLADVEISPVHGQSNNIFINGYPSNSQTTKIPESTTASTNSGTIAEETFTNKVENKPDPIVDKTPSSTTAMGTTLPDSESSAAIVSSSSTISEVIDEKEESIELDEAEDVSPTNPTDDEPKTNEQILTDANS